MNVHWFGIISAILALFAFFITYRTANKAGKMKRILFAAMAFLTAIPGLSFATYYAHIFPEPSWYYEFRSKEGCELLLIFVGVAGGLLASLLPRLLLTLPLLGVVAFSIAPFIKPFIGPIAADTFQNQWDGDVCLQSTPSTCGAASTATILKMFAVDAAESKIAQEAHSYDGGTEAWYLARAIRSRGFDVDFSFTPGFSPQDGLPAVVGVRLGSVGHFITVLGQEGDRFIIGDPLRGREILSRSELEDRYDFTPFHMHVRKKQ